jgi:putative membrane protein
MTKSPRAFRLEETGDDGAEGRSAITLAPDHRLDEVLAGEARPEPAAIPAPRRRGFGWLSLLLSAIGGLMLMAAGLWAERFVRALMLEHPWLAPVGIGLLALAALALLALAGREAGAILRARRIEKLSAAVAAARQADDGTAAKALSRDLVALYAGRPETANARARIEAIEADIIDGRDRLDVTERELMGPLDARARAAIAEVAQQVSVVTAISPRAVVDILFVFGQSIRLVRLISGIYGGRPGFLGFVRVARSVLAHLAITGGIAIGDSFVQQLVGQGLAARLSARLGEGVVNGLLTARVGLSALAVCRPMPFSALEPPGLTEVAGALLRRPQDPGAANG